MFLDKCWNLVKQKVSLLRAEAWAPQGHFWVKMNTLQLWSDLLELLVGRQIWEIVGCKT